LISKLNAFEDKSVEDKTKSSKTLLIGLFVFIIAASPYLLLNLKPSWFYENTRHQILIKYGTPFILLFFLNKFIISKYKIIILTFIITSSIYYNLNSLLRFQKSWLKQEAIEMALRSNKSIKQGDNFIIVDEAKDYNEYKNGTYSLYCYTGIASRSFKNQSHLIIDKENLTSSTNDKIIDSILYPQIKYYYNIKDIVNLNHFDYSFIIKKGNTPLTFFQTFFFTYNYFFNKEKFKKNLSGIVTLDYNKSIKF
jgi:hypothetical protein